MAYNQLKVKKPPLLFYIVAGLATLAALWAMTAYIMRGLEQGVFLWWAYLPVMAFMLVLLTGEQILFGHRR